MTRSFVLCLTGARRAPPRKVSLIFPDCFPGAQPDPVGEQWSAAAPGRRALWRRFSLRRFVLGRRPESGHIRERQIRLHRLQCRSGSFFFTLTPLKIITPTTLSWLRRDCVTVVLSCRTWWPPRSFTVTRRPRTSRWSPPPSMGWRRSPAESWWTPRMHCSPTQTTRWDTGARQQRCRAGGGGGTEWSAHLIFEASGLEQLLCGCRFYMFRISASTSVRTSPSAGCDDVTANAGGKRSRGDWRLLNFGRWDNSDVTACWRWTTTERLQLQTVDDWTSVGEVSSFTLFQFQWILF